MRPASRLHVVVAHELVHIGRDAGQVTREGSGNSISFAETGPSTFEDAGRRHCEK